jgi:hypothetical protein
MTVFLLPRQADADAVVFSDWGSPWGGQLAQPSAAWNRPQLGQRDGVARGRDGVARGPLPSRRTNPARRLSLLWVQW